MGCDKGTLTYLDGSGKNVNIKGLGKGGPAFVGLKGLTLFPAFSTSGNTETFTIVSQKHLAPLPLSQQRDADVKSSVSGGVSSTPARPAPKPTPTPKPAPTPTPAPRIPLEANKTAVCKWDTKRVRKFIESLGPVEIWEQYAEAAEMEGCDGAMLVGFENYDLAYDFGFAEQDARVVNVGVAKLLRTLHLKK